MSDNNNKPEDNNDVRIGFGKVLDKHGYGFQYGILKHANTLWDKGESKWVFEAVEFPVQVQGEGTRIDFILKLKTHTPIFLIAECKRANPALSNWCFIKAPYVRRNRTNEHFLIEWIQQMSYGSMYAYAFRGNTLSDAYHIALEVKSDEKGDPHGSGRGAIEESATQICKGLNGFIEFTTENRQILSDKISALFLPVIFTTAKIWTSDVNLSLTDLRNGRVVFKNTKLNEKNWIFYQYHLSPGIKHTHSPMERKKEIGEILDSEYIRTIAIVSASGVEEFLKWSSDSENYLD